MIKNSVRLFRVIGLFCFVMCFASCASKQAETVIEEPVQEEQHKVRPEVDRGPFPYRGEVLDFVAQHVQTRLALATAQVKVSHEMVSEDGHNVIHIEGWAKSNALVNLVAKIDDKVEAYIDAKSWESIFGYKHLNENKRERKFSVWFWPKEFKAVVEREYKGETTTRDVPIPGASMDSIAWIYELRSTPLENGSQRTWTTYDGWTINTVTALAVVDEEVWTEMGFIDCQKIEVYRERSDASLPMGALSGVYVDPEGVVSVEKYLLGTVWLARDEKRTPIRFAVKTGLGEFDLHVVKVSYE